MRPGTCVIGGFLVIGIVFRCGMTAAADPPVGPSPIEQAADSSGVTAKPAGNVHTAPEGEIPVPPPQERRRCQKRHPPHQCRRPPPIYLFSRPRSLHPPVSNRACSRANGALTRGNRPIVRAGCGTPKR